MALKEAMPPPTVAALLFLMMQLVSVESALLPQF
jgi:hypothetical protein